MKVTSKFNTNLNLSFKGTPKELLQEGSVIAKYDYLANGSYLDVHDDLFAPQNKEIRRKNLSFLDNISDFYKEIFIKHFNNVTGFPDLKKVSENIENEFIRSVEYTSRKLFHKEFDVIAMGYDATCSVGKRKALPGSDLDKAFIIIRGSDNMFVSDETEAKYVDKFKETLWNITDQRILSYNHDTSFPNIYTLQQIKKMMHAIEKKTNLLNVNYNKMKYNVENEYINLLKAAEFNIELSELLPARRYESLPAEINKETVKNFAYFLEAMRDGLVLKNSKEFKELIKDISCTSFYKYSNVAQMKAMKNAVNSGREQKTKIILRKNLEQDFNNWSLEKQYRFVKTLIKYSCEDQDDFHEYFSNDINVKESYKPLLGLLCYGDAKRFINPEFQISDNLIEMYITKNNPISLYQGFSPEVLWVETRNKEELLEVLLHIDKIRKIDLFKNINRVQAPISSGYVIPEGFYSINFNTAEGYPIIERFLHENK